MNSEAAPPLRRPIETTEEALALARETVERLSDRQAADIVLLDVHGITPIADYFVIATAETQRQLRALQSSVGELFATKRIAARRDEGTSEDGWILLDFGSIIVHLFDPEQRGIFQLERVWERATPLIRMK